MTDKLEELQVRVKEAKKLMEGWCDSIDGKGRYMDSEKVCYEGREGITTALRLTQALLQDMIEGRRMVPGEPTRRQASAGCSAILYPKLIGNQGSELKEAIDSYEAAIKAAPMSNVERVMGEIANEAT